MSLIFDRFPNVALAEMFQRAVEKRFPAHATQLWMSQDEMENLCMRQLHGETKGTPEHEIQTDVFPFQLVPPIVLVDRTDDGAHEREIEDLVCSFMGDFAGA